MKKKLLSLLLTLAMCLSLLPVTAFAAQADLPDWYFLFAIFKNVDADGKGKDGKVVHTKYSMTQDEIDYAKAEAKDFEEYMNSVGVMQAHVEIVEIDTVITELGESSMGSWLSSKQAAPILQDRVNLDQYDHVACYVSLDNLVVSWLGLTGTPFENGTGQSCINLKNREYCLNRLRPLYEGFPSAVSVHEFLHVMEQMTKKWGTAFNQHEIKGNFYPESARKTSSTDIILNQAKGTAETGTGVAPTAWQYPPHVLRTMTELNVSSSVTGIGAYAFRNHPNLKKLTIPGSVDSIEKYAFLNCTGLTELTLLPGVTSIGNWAFGCSEKQGALAKVTIPASVTNIGYAAFWKTGIKDVYYTGTEAQWNAIKIGEYNKALTEATIHYNHLMADVKTGDWFAEPVAWALENGVTNGTGNGKFSPGEDCTVAQILTFLWRANGSPEPTGGNPFSDVKGGDWYADAAAWAYEKGMVSGEALGVNTPCTRAMAVTYMWKAAGSPGAKAAAFTDVPANADYARAVDWAVENGVTKGTGAATFSPGSICTRGTIVTFLYRAPG